VPQTDALPAELRSPLSDSSSLHHLKGAATASVCSRMLVGSELGMGGVLSGGIILEEPGNVSRGLIRLRCEEYVRAGVRLQWVRLARVLLLRMLLLLRSWREPGGFLGGNF
jgi:hypothetical protein